MSKKARELAARYGRKSDIIEIAEDIISENYHVNGFSHPDYPIITIKEEVQVYKWGLIPSWIPSVDDAERIRNMTLNAKAETIFTKPSFRHSIKVKRCIVPSTGFFEWRHEKGRKIPYFITVKDEDIFSMAGIYDVWHNPDTGVALHTFSIITTQANEMMSYIHNTQHRMPVLLRKEDEERWLDPNLDKDKINDLLKPYKSDSMASYIINPDFMRKNPHDPTIINPL